MLISCFYLKEKCSGRRRYLCGVCRVEYGAGEAAGPGWPPVSRMPGHVPEPYPGLGLAGPRHPPAPASPQLCQGWGWGELRGGWDQQSAAHRRCQRKGTRVARPGHPAPAPTRQMWHRQTLTGGETPWSSLHRQLGC